ncbi:MAG: hypothetical protein ACRD1L_09075, partial [Terriglobales bacterium]
MGKLAIRPRLPSPRVQLGPKTVPLLLAALALLLEIAFVAVALQSRAAVFPLLRSLIWLSGAAIFYLIAVVAVLRRSSSSSSGRAGLRVILLAAVVFRLTLLPVTPRVSPQLRRFHWDAKIQQVGFNPYAFAPQDPLFNPIRGVDDRKAPEPAV